MNEVDVAGLVHQWETFRDAANPATELLHRPLRTSHVAFSFLSSRREYWEALVGMTGFAKSSDLQPRVLLEQLGSGSVPHLTPELRIYLDDTFAGESERVFAAAQMSLAFVPIATYSRVMELMGDVQRCRELCAGDTECIRKCLLGHHHDSVDDIDSLDAWTR